jgi:hypothetical protein
MDVPHFSNFIDKENIHFKNPRFFTPIKEFDFIFYINDASEYDQMDRRLILKIIKQPIREKSLEISESIFIIMKLQQVEYLDMFNLVTWKKGEDERLF